MTFRIYNTDTGGSSLWSETAQVVVSTGIFVHKIGSVNPLNIDWSKGTYYLELSIEGVTLSPRERFTSVPYAFEANTLSGRTYEAFVSTWAVNQTIDGVKTFTSNIIFQGTATKLYVAGNFTATGTKSFEIEHPTKKGYKLVHSCIEGPGVAVYYRGEGQLQNGKAIIQLPEYFEALTRDEDRTIPLTNIDGFDKLCVKTQDGKVIKDGKFIVISDNPNSTQRFFWEAKAVRKDIKLVVEKSRIKN